MIAIQKRNRVLRGIAAILTMAMLVNPPSSRSGFAPHPLLPSQGNLSKNRQAEIYCALNMSNGSSAPDPRLGLVPLPFADWYAHYISIWEATEQLRNIRPFARSGGYSGPWLENWFIDTFASTNPETLRATWYPLLPIFAQWTDMCCSYNLVALAHNADVNTVFNDLVRDDVIYFAVTQQDLGTPGPWLLEPHLYRNTIVASAGGWGNVPVPLIMGRETFVPASERKTRVFAVSFVGAMHYGRDQILVLLKNSTLPENMYVVTTGEYHSIFSTSLFVLAPRGLGRASYRMYQALQMGVIPIYLNFESGPESGEWVPYAAAGFWNDPRSAVGFTATYAELPRFLCGACMLLVPGSGLTSDSLRKANPWVVTRNGKCPCTPSVWRDSVGPGAGFRIPIDSALVVMETKLAQSIETFFTYEGVIEQLHSFVRNPLSSNLTAQKKPESFGSYNGKSV